MAEVTVLVPFFNSGRWIVECVESVFKQTVGDWDLALIDDGSTDDSVARIEPYLKDKRARLIKQDRGGPSAARNAGLKSSSSPFIAILDSDDVWTPVRLEKSLAALKADTTRDYCYSTAFDMREDGTVIKRRALETYPDDRFLPALIDHNFVPSGTITFTRRCLEKVGLFDPQVNGVEDYDYSLRAAAAGLKFAAIDEPLIYFRYHDANLSSEERVFQSRLRLIEKLAPALAEYPAEVRRHRGRIYYSYAIHHLLRGQSALAREKLVKAMALDPWRPWTYYLYAKACLLGLRSS